MATRSVHSSQLWIKKLEQSQGCNDNNLRMLGSRKQKVMPELSDMNRSILVIFHHLFILDGAKYPYRSVNKRGGWGPRENKRKARFSSQYRATASKLLSISYILYRTAPVPALEATGTGREMKDAGLCRSLSYRPGCFFFITDVWFGFSEWDIGQLRWIHYSSSRSLLNDGVSGLGLRVSH